jgi:repressor LexA
MTDDISSIARDLIKTDPALAAEVHRILAQKAVGHVSLTQRQQDLLVFIKSYLEANGGIAPSYGEMCDHLGLVSKSGINRLVRGLEERGVIRRLPHRVRSIIVVEQAA